ncbi:MAG: hypothetical protein QOJ11_3336 [Frankiales bacterium]|nr:hypothetical protein [Frankiales bacterium]
MTSTSTRTAQDLIVSQRDLRVIHDAPPVVEEFTVSVERVLAGADADAAWATYRESLAPLAGVAAMKQQLPEVDLRAALADPAILKYVGRDGAGAVVAVLTVTPKLTTENINAVFYQQRYPEHHAAGRLLYLGFLVVRPEAQARGLIMLLVGRVTADLEAAGGVVAFDVCGYNDEMFAFARLCRLVAARTRPAVLTTLDVQTYYAIEVPPLR